MNMSLWQQVEQDIGRHLNRNFKIIDKRNIGGGSINNAFRISDGKDTFFIKTNRQQLAFMFEAEARGLEVMFDSGAIKVPEPVSHGVAGHESYSVLSWLNMSGQPRTDAFGRQLAALHRCYAEQFGFFIDNSIGSTPQLNQWSDDWYDFWKKQRLGYQLDLAKQRGFGARLYDLGIQLSERIPQFFDGYQPRPSLLHGDLWSGNWAGDESGQPVIFDPATYYGDHEADLAMMELFGHPGRAFFDAYNEVYPMDQGYSLRRTFYNLYHILNHANLFGSSYAMQAENMLETLLAEVR
jgi:fructosamine-3-kinase